MNDSTELGAEDSSDATPAEAVPAVPATIAPGAPGGAITQLVTAGAQSATPADPGAPRHHGRIVALAIVALVLAGGIGWLGYRLLGPEPQTRAQQVPAQQVPVPQPPELPAPGQAAILAAGQHGIETIGTFSYVTVDADLQRILAVTTGDLRNQFQSGLDSTRSQIVDQRLTKKATVLPDDQGVVVASATTATVTLLIQSEDTSRDQPSGRVHRYRVDLTMVRTNGAWLVSAVTTPVLAP